MFRSSFAALTVLLLSSASLSAQQWAEKMFTETSHDFGAVARAGKIEHSFLITNLYKEEVHIASVRSSCGCTLPRIAKDTLKTHEQGAIIAAFNTMAFTGQRGARVTVTIDKPFYAEVQLQVRGYIRTDVVIDPNEVAFGSVDQGKTAEKHITIDYAGRNDWKIKEVKSNSPHLTARVKEISRGNGLVSYQLAVRLNEHAPAGYLKDQLLVLTNDQKSTQLPITVEGLVVSDLTVSPSALMLGILQPGQTVTKQLILKGKKPFKIVSVQCENNAFEFKVSDEAKAVHLLPITFSAGDKPGKIAQRIRIRTDLEHSSSMELSAFGEVTAPLAGK